MYNLVKRFLSKIHIRKKNWRLNSCHQLDTFTFWSIYYCTTFFTVFEVISIKPIYILLLQNPVKAYAAQSVNSEAGMSLLNLYATVTPYLSIVFEPLTIFNHIMFDLISTTLVVGLTPKWSQNDVDQIPLPNFKIPPNRESHPGMPRQFEITMMWFASLVWASFFCHHVLRYLCWFSCY